MIDITDLIAVITQFLTQLIGNELAGKALGLVPVILALVGLARYWVPWFEERKRWAAPALAGVLGLIGGVWAAWPAWWPLGLWAGLLVAMAAIGTHSAGKNLLQGTRGGSGTSGQGTPSPETAQGSGGRGSAGNVDMTVSAMAAGQTIVTMWGRPGTGTDGMAGVTAPLKPQPASPAGSAMATLTGLPGPHVTNGNAGS